MNAANGCNSSPPCLYCGSQPHDTGSCEHCRAKEEDGNRCDGCYLRKPREPFDKAIHLLKQRLQLVNQSLRQQAQVSRRW